MISIIIPCYNISQYIGRTISSVLSQTDSDWEIIAVDDGSIDSTLSVLKEFAESDYRIRIYHQENKGVSAARNLGLKHAIGEWIYFLDGDDIIENQFVHKINSIEHNVDIALFGFEIRYTSKSKIFIPHASTSIINDFLTNKQKIVMCSICFKKALLDNNFIKFDEATFYSEDREFIINALIKAKHIEYLKDVLFIYIRRNSSAMGKKIYNEKSFTSIEACERLFKKLYDTSYHNDTLVQLKTTLLLHWKKAMDYGCSEDLKERLNIYMAKYLNKKTNFSLNRDALFAYIASIIFKNEYLFKRFINLIP